MDRGHVLTVELSSRGPWYDPLIKAHAMLGHRSVRKRQMPYSTVTAQIEAKLRASLAKTSKERAPSIRMVQNWEEDWPDYPEWAMRVGLINKEELLPWAREYLNEEAQLSQSLGTTFDQRKKVPIAGKQQGVVIGARVAFSPSPKREGSLIGERSLGGLLLLMGALWLLSKLFEPQRRVLPSSGGSPRPRLLRGLPAPGPYFQWK
jgi:hypothetical protein